MESTAKFSNDGKHFPFSKDSLLPNTLEILPTIAMGTTK